jgi:hypothetical protein
MTNEQLTAYLQDETYLYSVSYEELKTLVMQYPYSANLRVLLLKKSFLDQNKDYERNLQMSASYGTNRKYLYKTIKKLKSFQLAPQNVILGEDYLELTELSNIERLLADKQVTEVFNTEPKLASLAQDWELEIDDIAFNEAIETDEETFDLSVLNAPIDKDSKKDRTEEEEIDSLINSLVSQYKIPPLNLSDDIHQEGIGDNSGLIIHKVVEDLKANRLESKEKKEDIIIEEEINALMTKKNFEPAIDTIAEEPKNNISQTELEEKESEQNVKKTNLELEIINQTKAPLVESQVTQKNIEKKPSFTEWLSQFRRTSSIAPNSIVQLKEIEEKPIVNQIVTPFQSDDLTRTTSKKNMTELFEAKNEVPDNLFGLVEKKSKIEFLENDEDDDDEEDEVFSDDDSVSSKKKKKRPMHQLAVKSLIEDNDLVSETLADLLAFQGNSKKAIDMYRKLILKFPEKSSFFATKIEKISN